MKKSAISVIVLAVIVIIAIVWFGHKPSAAPDTSDLAVSGTTTASVIVSESTKVSNNLSEYQNAELGFSVKYPSAWEREDTNSGVNFVIPIDKNQVSTLATLQATIQVVSGTCAFPPVTTVKDRGTSTFGGNAFNMITMSNSVQGRTYYNRMYSLQKDSVCYLFNFQSIALAPTSKNLTGSQGTQAQNNNKAIDTDIDSAFTAMVKSFTFIQGPAGKDETQASPAK